MPKAAYFVGKVGLVVVLYVGQVILLIALGVALFDVHLPDSAADWWTFTWVSVLGLVCCTLLGVAFTGVTRTGRGAPALVSPVVLVLQFTSGVFFQYDELPPWMQQMAALFPLKWLCQGMRSVFLPDTFQRQELAGSWELDRVALVLARLDRAGAGAGHARLPLAPPRRALTRALPRQLGQAGRQTGAESPMSGASPLPSVTGMTVVEHETTAGFLTEPPPTPESERMYAADLAGLGYVARLTRIWAHSPTSLSVLSTALAVAVEEAGLTVAQRALLVSACASAMSDAYCSLAWGAKLAATAGDTVAADVLREDDSGLPAADRALAAWARRVARDPNAATADDVDDLRSAGFDDRAIFAITLFLALRIAFSSVNDALGAVPDPALAQRAPDAVRRAVTFGRIPTP